MTQAQNETGTSTSELIGQIKKQKAPPPIEAGEHPTRDLLHVGNTARQVLQVAKMPRHWWAVKSAWELVLAALGQYQKERTRVLAQRQQLRQLHAKVLQQKGELASKSQVVANLLTTLERQKNLIEEMKRNR